jgi:hypothetical protein
VKGKVIAMIPNVEQLKLFRASGVAAGSPDLVWVADQSLAGDPRALQIVADAMGKAAAAIADAKVAAAALRAAVAGPVAA